MGLNRPKCVLGQPPYLPTCLPSDRNGVVKSYRIPVQESCSNFQTLLKLYFSLLFASHEHLVSNRISVPVDIDDDDALLMLAMMMMTRVQSVKISTFTSETIVHHVHLSC